MLGCVWLLDLHGQGSPAESADAASRTKAKMDKCVHFYISCKNEDTLVGNYTDKNLSQKLGIDSLRTFYLNMF